ncbi:DUF732 domain-containing protein [Mycobacterium sp. 21AC1]|uniref:DUF732 domain-containing protein n=1 Tax=[Mycobacterium] appelbergii TaxID=2939269 RepID=UPI002939435D|nr:DUF732 domain-containing protein [Mycobacterium sp. 21AC1]MDV3125900.1 DUF732 domain-containing protein [Mycobacterium sp. 21AC1]
MKRALLALIACGATSLAISAPAHADPDTDFSRELHTYGIYGQKDYNAWIGKLACKRLSRGVDTGAQESAKFVSDQLSKDSTTEQAWQFLGGAINYYCPDQRVVLERAAAAH